MRQSYVKASARRKKGVRQRMKNQFLRFVIYAGWDVSVLCSYIFVLFSFSWFNGTIFHPVCLFLFFFLFSFEHNTFILVDTVGFCQSVFVWGVRYMYIYRVGSNYFEDIFTSNTVCFARLPFCFKHSFRWNWWCSIISKSFRHLNLSFASGFADSEHLVQLGTCIYIILNKRLTIR